jgi:phosphoglucomutase
MAHYLLSSLKEQNKLPANGVVIKTIVTSEMGAVVAGSFNIPTLNTLTGFKYIGEKMTQFEVSGEHQFIFGYEESYGYLAGNYARDKDAVVASMLICEAAAYYKSLGKSLFDVLQELYQKHGFFLEKLESRTLKGKDGLAKIGQIMDDWRSNPPQSVQGINVASVLDYSKGIDDLPAENVLKYVLDDHSWFCLRPSGTEPKIKVYFAVRGSSGPDSAKRIDALVKEVMARVDQ